MSDVCNKKSVHKQNDASSDCSFTVEPGTLRIITDGTKMCNRMTICVSKFEILLRAKHSNPGWDVNNLNDTP